MSAMKRGPSTRAIVPKRREKHQNSFLEYLDKEMTIMGILSTFSVAAVTLFLKEVGSAEPAKKTLFSLLWLREPWCVLLGSAWILTAAGLFYSQRSTLAWYYGQITLATEAPRQINNLDPVAWMKEADSWDTWTAHRVAFWCLRLGIFTEAFAFLQLVLKRQLPWICVIVSGVVVLVAVFGEVWVYRRLRDEDEPWKAFFRSLI
jgi:hypothetical protein